MGAIRGRSAVRLAVKREGGIRILIIRGLVGGLFQLVLFGVFLIVPAGLVATLAILLIPIARIVVEEKTLRETLPGYGEYTAKVRYRLLPFVW